MRDGKDVMVDIETFDTKPSAAILSIGACVVNWDAPELPLDPFYVVIDLEDNLARGRTKSESTEAWWSQQSEDARKIFSDPNRVDLETGLLRFRTYLGSQCPFKKLKLWGNGSDFDNTLLADAYRGLDITAPWPFYNNRCFRTIRKELGHMIREPDREGTHHNALDDAIFQAHILAMFKAVLT